MARSRPARAASALAVATLLWLPAVHLLFRPAPADLGGAPREVSPLARALVARHLRLWSDPALRAVEVERMRRSNAEWDFMGRTFLVLALADLALRDPAEQPRCLAAIDAVLDETRRLERTEGQAFFLLGYARSSPWVVPPGRSLFVDGEIALMEGARCLVADRPDLRPDLRERAAAMQTQMERSPVLSGESYPDECWTFCNTVALAAMRMQDVLEGSDHRAFFRRWVETARARLVHAPTGLLISAYSVDGARVPQGPEGSSIWMAAHCLQVVDPAFARDQYQRARRELGAVVLGFGYAREWPASAQGPADVDSGPIVPGLEASASSSGLALLGAASFGDREYLGALVSSLELAAFPVREGETLRYAASNQVGDAVLLHALLHGPLWARLAPAEGAR